MARTLPWLKDSTTSIHTSSSSSRASKALQTKNTRHDKHVQSPSPASKSTARTSPPAYPHHAARVASHREPSTSPPPTPPSVTYMRPSDHGWIMVEDEFLATAQTFTKHLHHAEYQRQKKLAAQSNKRRRDDVVEADAKLDPQTKREIEVARKRKKFDRDVDDALDKLGGTEGKAGKEVEKDLLDSDYIEEDELIIGDRNLAGLMFNAGRAREKRDLKALASTGSTGRTITRAAAGLRRQGCGQDSSHTKTEVQFPIDDDEMTSDEEDLDVPVRTKKEPKLAPHPVEKPLLDLQQTRQPRPCRPPPVRDKPISEGAFPVHQIKTQTVEDTVKDRPRLLPVQPPNPPTDVFTVETQVRRNEASASLAAWRKAREARRNKHDGTDLTVKSEKEVSSIEDIPTFLF